MRSIIAYRAVKMKHLQNRHKRFRLVPKSNLDNFERPQRTLFKNPCVFSEPTTKIWITAAPSRALHVTAWLYCFHSYDWFSIDEIGGMTTSLTGYGSGMIYDLSWNKIERAYSNWKLPFWAFSVDKATIISGWNREPSSLPLGYAIAFYCRSMVDFGLSTT